MSNVYEALEKTMADINDIVALAKSSGLAKDTKEDDKMKKADPEEEQTPPAPAPEEAPAEEFAPAQEGEQAPAQEMPGDEQPEGEEGQGEEETVEQHAESMSDEELDMMLQVLSAEKEKRASAQTAPEQAPPAQEGQGQLEMSLKDDYAKMQKSMNDMSAQLAKVTEELVSFKTPTKTSKVTSKVTASNTKDIQVLEKSSAVAKRLSKSETIDFLHGQIRKRNPLVSSDVVADVNLARTDSELAAIQDSLAVKGLEFPKK